MDRMADGCWVDAMVQVQMVFVALQWVGGAADRHRSSAHEVYSWNVQKIRSKTRQGVHRYFRDRILSKTAQCVLITPVTPLSRLGGLDGCVPRRRTARRPLTERSFPYPLENSGVVLAGSPAMYTPYISYSSTGGRAGTSERASCSIGLLPTTTRATRVWRCSSDGCWWCWWWHFWRCFSVARTTWRTACASPNAHHPNTTHAPLCAPY